MAFLRRRLDAHAVEPRALTAARHWLAEHSDARVVVVAPTQHLKRQWASAAAADAFVAVSLADSLFFSISTEASRQQVLVYLLINLVPFAILAPLGPGARVVVRGLIPSQQPGANVATYERLHLYRGELWTRGIQPPDGLTCEPLSEADFEFRGGSPRWAAGLTVHTRTGELLTGEPRTGASQY